MDFTKHISEVCEVSDEKLLIGQVATVLDHATHYPSFYVSDPVNQSQNRYAHDSTIQIMANVPEGTFSIICILFQCMSFKNMKEL